MASAARGARAVGIASASGATIRLPRVPLGAPIRPPRRRHKRRSTASQRRRIRQALGAIDARALLAGLLAFLRAMPDHRWLDRLVRSRWWIPVLGVMLTVIVAMQVEVLKSGAGTGRAINLATRLESRNQLLSASVAELDSPQRIEQAAAQMGMVMAGPTSVQFLNGGTAGALREAISHITAPNSQSFMSALAAAAGTATAAGGTATAAGGTATAAGGTATDAGGTTPTATGGTTPTATGGATTGAEASPAGAGTAAAPLAATGATSTSSTTATGAGAAGGAGTVTGG